MQEINVQQSLELLGHKVRDRVTSFEGVVTTIGIDLYGCVQATVNPQKVNDSGEIQKGAWFDTSRLEKLSETPVMTPPKFSWATLADRGPAEKPEFSSLP